MPAMDSYVIIDTATLEMLNLLAHKKKLKRKLSSAFIDNVDPEGRHVVAFSFIHNDTDVRMTLAVKMKDTDLPVHATLDTPVDKFMELQRFTYDDDGNLVEVMKDGKTRIVIRRKDRVTAEDDT